jgi:hypothetical protein
MKTRQILGYIIAFLLILVSIDSALSLTASMGNARMILYPNMEEGKPYLIERTILVKNVNDIPLKITLEPMGALENQTEIIDTNFVLQPNETRNARFSITILGPGKYETNVGVSFYPENSTKEEGVGLMSNIIIMANINQTGPTNNWVNHTQTGQATAPSKNSWLNYGIAAAALAFIILVLILIGSRIASNREEDKSEGKKSGKKEANTRRNARK